MHPCRCRAVWRRMAPARRSSWNRTTWSGALPRTWTCSSRAYTGAAHTSWPDCHDRSHAGQAAALCCAQHVDWVQETAQDAKFWQTSDQGVSTFLLQHGAASCDLTALLLKRLFECRRTPRLDTQNDGPAVLCLVQEMTPPGWLTYAQQR